MYFARLMGGKRHCLSRSEVARAGGGFRRALRGPAAVPARMANYTCSARNRWLWLIDVTSRIIFWQELVRQALLHPLISAFLQSRFHPIHKAVAHLLSSRCTRCRLLQFAPFRSACHPQRLPSGSGWGPKIRWRQISWLSVRESCGGNPNGRGIHLFFVRPPVPAGPAKKICLRP